MFECTQCGAAVANPRLHLSICPKCPLHIYVPQWGDCLTCSHADASSCHVEHSVNSISLPVSGQYRTTPSPAQFRELGQPASSEESPVQNASDGV